jgi:hypothetical protein
LSVLESLKSRGEALVQPRTDAGILIGVAMVALFFVINNTRGGVRR